MPDQISGEEKKNAYDQGKQAFIEGTPRHKNPYARTEKEDLAVFWNDGWDWAEMESQDDSSWDSE